MLLVPTLLIIAAVYIGLRNPAKRKLLKMLIAIVLAGIVVVATHLYFLHTTTCGDRYDSDIGCLDVLPGWVTILGMGLFLLSVIVSIVIILMPARNKPRD